MPELPEVETTRRGLAPHLTGRRVAEVVVREPRLRWPVSASLREDLVGAAIQDVGRRAKYLLIATDRGTLIIHLGMSGSLRVLQGTAQVRKHDHVDIVLEEGTLVRYTDPRRFGAVLWWTGEPGVHPLLAELGPEPWSEGFNADYLYRVSRGRRCTVKSLIMDSRIVAGVGNIYASEALFAAGILPARAAGRISRERYAALVREVQRVLQRAVELGGTTLRDFTGAEGRPGYFRQTLNVYGREGQPCRSCGDPLRGRRIGQRASVYCARCQR